MEHIGRYLSIIPVKLKIDNHQLVLYQGIVVQKLILSFLYE